MAYPIFNRFTHNSKLADHEPKWSDVDKTELPDIAFADETDRKYPHHWVKGGTEKDADGRWKNGTLYLSEGGLDAAWAAAHGARSGKEASEAVKKHLEAHRKAIGKDDSKNDFSGYRVMNMGDELEIFCYGPIGETWDGTGLTAKQVAADLQNSGPVSRISIHLNSPGGEVFTAVTLVNLLKSHKAHVHVMIEGLAASAGSVLAMAGDTIEAAANSLIMVHDPYTFCVGNSGQLRKEADMLDQVRDTIVQTYSDQARKAGKKTSAAKFAELMAAETWLCADDALKYGLIDQISEPMRQAAFFDLSKFNYRNAPRIEQPRVSNDTRRRRLAVMEMQSRLLEARRG